MAAGLADSIEYGQAYNAGSQRAIKISDLIDIIIDLTSSRKPVLQETSVCGRRIRKYERCSLIAPALYVRLDGHRGSSCARLGKDGRVVALSSFRQAGPPAEGLHHMTAPRRRMRVGLRCGALAVESFSRSVAAGKPDDDELLNRNDRKNRGLRIGLCRLPRPEVPHATTSS